MSNYFLMKAHTVNPKKLTPGITRWSVKLDGMRALWDGGITRGRQDVPWCRGERATGLWTINANIIHAPDYWLDRLPKGVFLDGELWAGVRQFYRVSSICRTKNDSKYYEWDEVQFKAFEYLRPDVVYTPRIIDQPTCSLILGQHIYTYMQELCRDQDIPWTEESRPSEDILIPSYVYKSLEEIPFNDLIDEGHEGVMFRNPSPWTPTRSWSIMKMKPFSDSEGVVIGYFGGRDRHLGRIGALLVRWGDKEFKLSGMTDDERESTDSEICLKHPGQLLPEGVEGSRIPLGSVVTFKYREISPDGIPKEARYWRTRS